VACPYSAGNWVDVLSSRGFGDLKHSKESLQIMSKLLKSIEGDGDVKLEKGMRGWWYYAWRVFLV
jgi:hypothetical protein